MKNVLLTLGTIGMFAGLGTFATAANKTMTGEISDSMCGASHAQMINSHKDAKMTDADCAKACVKAGAKYVFVSSGKVYNISNQDLASLNQYAGEKVKLTGDVSGENVTVSKISASK